MSDEKLDKVEFFPVPQELVDAMLRQMGLDPDAWRETTGTKDKIVVVAVDKESGTITVDAEPEK